MFILPSPPPPHRHALPSLGLNTRLSTTRFTIMMIRRIFIVSLISTATTAFVVGPQQARRIFPLSSASPKTQKIVYSPPLRMVGAGIDPTSSSPSPESTELNNPSTRFGDPLTDEMKAFNKGAVGFLKRTIFDTLFAGRDYPRFYALETIARVPYFSYTAALHWYETIGMWRKAKYLKIHFAEDLNEMHHLLIMESLGGADRWFDRFVAQHIGISYYLVALGLYFWNPTMAYNLNQYVEEHAFLTYDQFLKEHEDELKAQPAPQVAIDYYSGDDLYMFDEFQTGSCEVRRPKIDNLYDVFAAIRDDEAEHVKTMTALQTETELSTSHDDSCEVPEELLGY